MWVLLEVKVTSYLGVKGKGSEGNGHYSDR